MPLFTIFFLLHSIVAAQNSGTSGNNLPHLADPNLQAKEVVNGLFMPTSISFIDNNDFIILQKNGTVNRVINDTLLSKPLLTLNVASGFYQGLLGSAISKDNKNNLTFVFLYFTSYDPILDHGNSHSNNSVVDNFSNKVYRYELIGNTLKNPRLLLKLPSTPGPEDNGGYMIIGPDNNLYIIIGDVADETNETSIKTLTQNFINSSIADGRSGILRITTDGLPVKNHEGYNGILDKKYPLSLYYAYGIHNGFGLDFDPLTGNLWDTETGHYINDEINLVLPGFNSGYGIIQGMSKFFPAAPFALVDFNNTGKYSDPKFVWSEKAVPTGIKFLHSDKLGTQYENDLFIGTFNDGKIYHFDLSSDRTKLILPTGLETGILSTLNSTVITNIVFGSNFEGISGLEVSPDGYLYVIGVNSGKIYKITTKNIQN